MRALVETGALAGERGAYRLARPLPAHPGAGDGASGPGRPHRPARPRRTSASCRSPPSSARTCPARLLQAIAELAGRAASPRTRPPAGRRVPVRDRPLSRPRVHLQARADPRGGLRQPAARSAPGRFTPGSWTPSRPGTPIASPSTSTASPTMRRGPSAGTRRPNISSERAHSARPIDRPTAPRLTGWSRRLAALEHLPKTRETLTRGLDVRFDVHLSLFALSEHARMRRHMEAAEQIADAIGDRHRLGQALSLLCPSLRVTGEIRRSAEVGRRALGDCRRGRRPTPRNGYELLVGSDACDAR